MKLFKKEFLFAAVALPALALTSLQAQVQVSFVESGQTTVEKGTVRIGIELSEPSLLEVSVPYIVSSESTATLDSDYTIPEDNEENGEVTFDNESPIVFDPGETLKYVVISMENDNVDENDEFLILELVSNGLTVATLGEQTRHQVRILDNDPVRAFFDKHEVEFSEANNITVNVELTDVVDQEVEVAFTTSLQTAGNDDIDLGHSFSSDSPITISEGVRLGSINIKTVNDAITDKNEGGADRETLLITITSAKLKDGTTIEFDAEPVVVTIVDNDPISVEFNYEDDQEFPVDIQEYETSGVTVILRDPSGDPTTAADVISVPINFSGGAVAGSGDDDDYNPGTDPIEINAGSSTGSLALQVNNDDSIEEDELIRVSIGSPSYKDGGDLVLGEKTEASFLIKDNDPVSLSFGALFSKDDAQAAEDEDYYNVIYVDSAGSIASEGLGGVTIPIYLSSISSNNVEFKLEMLTEGTTAKVFDSSNRDDDTWDYSVTSHALSNLGDTTDVVIRAGFQQSNLSVQFNNDEETPTIFGQPPAADVESDEYVKFRISAINTDSSKVIEGSEMTYTLTIRDLPDIDITDVMQGLSPNPAMLENGGLKFNDQTGLFEAFYSMQSTVAINPADYPGYGGLKFRYRTTNYDAANAEADSNDPIVQTPENPGVDERFDYVVSSPYQLRFPHATDQIILIEGQDPVDDKYDVTTADTIELAPYIIRPIDFPRLNDFEAENEGGLEINETMDWTVEFYSNGYFHFPTDRIDPAVNPDRMRVYLSEISTPSFASSGTAMSISKFEPQADGSVLLVIETGGSNVQIQYLDPGDKWRIAHPQLLSSGGSSKLYWMDQGPPHTITHPKNVKFRLYRAVSN